ncbi:MAG: hypothetical protein FJ295_11000 [Planctomycetes bacterium]|nr:hypothetical protein [Planctomycetota bacterium]
MTMKAWTTRGLLALVCAIALRSELRGVELLAVGSALELAVDPRWIDRMDRLDRVAHPPLPREVVLELRFVMHDADLFAFCFQ